MQLIFSGIRFEDLKELTGVFQDSDTVMAKEHLRHREIEKKNKEIYFSETAGEKLSYSHRKLFRYKYTYKFF